MGLMAFRTYPHSDANRKGRRNCNIAITIFKSNTYRDFGFAVVGFHQEWELNLG